MLAHIYKKRKSAVQSGNKQGLWVLRYQRQQPQFIDPLMGYTSSVDMLAQVTLSFSSLQAAIDYANANSLSYRVEPEQTPKRRAISYSANFASNRVQPWTH